MLRIESGHRTSNGTVITYQQAYRYNLRVDMINGGTANRRPSHGNHDYLLTRFWNAIMRGDQSEQERVWLLILEDIVIESESRDTVSELAVNWNGLR